LVENALKALNIAAIPRPVIGDGLFEREIELIYSADSLDALSKDKITSVFDSLKSCKSLVSSEQYGAAFDALCALLCKKASVLMAAQKMLNLSFTEFELLAEKGTSHFFLFL